MKFEIKKASRNPLNPCRLFALLALIFPLTVSGAEKSFSSKYSSLTDQDCKIVKRGTVPYETFTRRCPSQDGYQITIHYADARTWLEVHGNGLSFDSLTGSTHFPGFFPIVSGKKLEWRYNEKNQLIGWIYRMLGSLEKEGKDGKIQSKDISKLIVVRLENGSKGPQACVLGNTQTNEAARKLLDQSKKCP